MKKWLKSFFLNKKERDELKDDIEVTEIMNLKSMPPEENNDGKELMDSESVPIEEEADSAQTPEGTIIIDGAEPGTEKILLVKNKAPKEKKPWSSLKKVIVFSCIGVFAAMLIMVGVWAITIMSNPLAQFNNDVAEKPSTTSSATNTSQSSNEATPEATPDPEAILLSQADMTFLDTNFVNIMLIGVDRSTDRLEDDWKGKDDFHADVMIVLTINRTTNEVSMISLPRDTYAKIPGVDGIYKLNCSINCGGGWCKEGFEKVCQAAQWMLGGDGSENDPIKINKYFAVDMNAVKELVDAIGGVDYDLDISFDNAGRKYTKQDNLHMDGQAVLDYLRVRKDEHIVEKGQSTDKHRVERQRKMLVAIFRKIQDNGLLFSLPSLITAFEGNLEYNLTFNEISALAYYAINIDPDSVKSYSMSGSYVLVIEHADDPFAFTFTNQANRVKIIEDVYGIKVSKRSGYTQNALQLRWGALEAKQFAKAADSVIAKAEKILKDDAKKQSKPKLGGRTLETDEPPATSPSETTPDPSEPTDPSPPPDEPSEPTLTPAPTAPPGGYRQYEENGPEWTLYKTVEAEYESVLKYKSYDSGEDLLALLEQFKKDVNSLCDMLGIKKPSAGAWVYDFQRKYNDIYVDMR